MTKLSFNGKRIVLGVGFCVSLLCVANYYLSGGVFGRFAKHAMVVSFVVVALLQHYVGPSIGEVQEYQNKKREAQPPS